MSAVSVAPHAARMSEQVSKSGLESFMRFSRRLRTVANVTCAVPTLTSASHRTVVAAFGLFLRPSSYCNSLTRLCGADLCSPGASHVALKPTKPSDGVVPMCAPTYGNDDAVADSTRDPRRAARPADSSAAVARLVEHRVQRSAVEPLAA